MFFHKCSFHELSLIIFFIISDSESIPQKRCTTETVSVIRSNRFFTLCHYPVSLLSPTAFLPPFRMTIGGKGVIMRETVIKPFIFIPPFFIYVFSRLIDSSYFPHHGNRSFTFASDDALPSFVILNGGKNDSGRQGVIVRETLIVIRSECEGSVTIVRKTVRCHSERQRRI